jgi:serine protease inhibitor
MSKRFREDMDKIIMDEKLKNKTVNLMRNALQKKQNNKRILFTRKSFLIPAISFCLLAAFVLGIPRAKNPAFVTVKAGNLMEGVKGKEVTLKTEFSKQFLDSTSEFSIDMFNRLSKEENAVYSPTPLYIALGLVLNGAEGKTKDELMAALGKYGITQEELNLYYKSLISQLTTNQKDTTLSISNSIWYDNDFNANQAFLETNKTFYDTYAYKLSFKDTSTPEVINSWVKQVTRDRIDKMVEKIDPEVVMMLFSSIYFDATWENQFSKNSTALREFKVKDSAAIKTDFMFKKDNMKYIDNEIEQAVLLPYNDGRFAFMAILPNEATDIREYIADLNKDSIAQKITSFETNEVTLYIPKFEVEFGKSIMDELKALGIKEMFDRSKANLRGMGSAGGNLYVSEVAQKTYIRVDEKGTEASSVVKVEVSAESMGTYIAFDRPFVYTIVDTTTNLPIFIGVMDNPKK